MCDKIFPFQEEEKGANSFSYKITTFGNSDMLCQVKTRCETRRGCVTRYCHSTKEEEKRANSFRNIQPPSEIQKMDLSS